MIEKRPNRQVKRLAGGHQGRWLYHVAKQIALFCGVVLTVAGCASSSSQLAAQTNSSDIYQASSELYHRANDWLVQQGVLETNTTTLRQRRVRQAQLRSDYRGVLEHSDILVYRLGNYVHVVIPNNKLFAFGSANLTSDGAELLGFTCRYMRTFSNIGRVNVEAYVSGRPLIGKPRHYKWALTLNRSRLVANRFGHCGLDTNFITAEAGGDHHAVAWNGTAEGRYFNRRVEVVFDVYRT